MKKINLIGIEFAILLMLILIPLASCYDLNGDGIDDGEQNLCGDSFCQSWETESTCSVDCQGVSPGEQSLSPTVPLANESNEIVNENNETLNNEANNSNNNSALDNESIPNEGTNISSTPSSQENLQGENVFFVSTPFKIIIGVVALIVIGLIIFFLIRANKNSNQNLENSNQNPAVSNSQ